MPAAAPQPSVSPDTAPARQRATRRGSATDLHPLDPARHAAAGRAGPATMEATEAGRRGCGTRARRARGSAPSTHRERLDA